MGGRGKRPVNFRWKPCGGLSRTTSHLQTQGDNFQGRRDGSIALRVLVFKKAECPSKWDLSMLEQYRQEQHEQHDKYLAWAICTNYANGILLSTMSTWYNTQPMKFNQTVVWCPRTRRQELGPWQLGRLCTGAQAPSREVLGRPAAAASTQDVVGTVLGHGTPNPTRAPTLTLERSGPTRAIANGPFGLCKAPTNTSPPS